MQFRNLMLAIGFVTLVLGTGKDGSSKDEAAHTGHGSSVKAVASAKGESKNVWYHEGQVKDKGRKDDAMTIAIDHKDKGTKTKGHDSHTTHVDSAPPKETGHKDKDHGKDDSHKHTDSSSSKESFSDFIQLKESISHDESYGSNYYKDSGSSEGSYDDSYNHHTSTVSVGPEETNLVEPSYNEHKSTVSIGPEETSLPESTSQSIYHLDIKTTHVEISMEHHTVTQEHHSDKKNTKTETKTLFSTHKIEVTASTEIKTHSVPAQIIVETSTAPPAAYTTAPSPAAIVQSTLATTVAGVFATSSFVPNTTGSAPPKFTGGSEQLGTNSWVAMAVALVALGWAVM